MKKRPSDKEEAMKRISGIGLSNVQAVYCGPEGSLWELVMGQQIHIGGLVSSMDLANQAGIQPGMTGVDLNCCNGAGIRFLLRFRQVARMHGVDATAKVLEQARQRCAAEGWSDRVALTEADSCATGLPDACVDFVWGEDAWCYVENKTALIAEATRLTRPGGTIAFTDWLEGTGGLSDAEAERLLKFMTFPNILSLSDYEQLLKKNGWDIRTARDTGRFAPHVDLYINMLGMQLTYDALRIIGYDSALMETLAGEMAFMRELAHAGKIIQGLLVAVKK